VSLSPSTITWYRPPGGDALRLQRSLPLGGGLIITCGWLPVYRD